MYDSNGTRKLASNSPLPHWAGVLLFQHDRRTAIDHRVRLLDRLCKDIGEYRLGANRLVNQEFYFPLDSPCSECNVRKSGGIRWFCGSYPITYPDELGLIREAAGHSCNYLKNKR
jgi:hypothetical protein